MSVALHNKSARAISLIASAALLASCKPGTQTAEQTSDVRGTPIRADTSGPIAPTNPSPALAQPRAIEPATGEMEGDYLRLGFNTLSNFKYDTYEVYDEVRGGRPLTRSDDVIPPEIRALTGKRVAIKGFVMPLRLKKGLVTEFLLFRDQAACCFGPAAKMNHYIRVKVNGAGFPPGSAVTHKVWGTLQVGEIFVQDYLTGIYQMTADKAAEEP